VTSRRHLVTNEIASAKRPGKTHPVMAGLRTASSIRGGSGAPRHETV
jgi:hypothetical protein